MRFTLAGVLSLEKKILRLSSLFHTPTGSAHRSVHSLFGFTNRRSDWLIGWRASDCDVPTLLLCTQINTGNTVPSSTWQASPTWRKQKAFPLPRTAALWVFWKSREFPTFFRGRGHSYACQHGTWSSLKAWWGLHWLQCSVKGRKY